MHKFFLKSAVLAVAVLNGASASWLTGGDKLPSVDELNDILGNFERRMAETHAEEMRALEARIRSEYEEQLEGLLEAADVEEELVEGNERELAGKNKMIKWKIRDLQKAVQQLQKAVTDLTRSQKKLDKKTKCISDLSGKDYTLFSGCNVQIVNGSHKTSTKNGLGNLLVGYSECVSGKCDRSGSHNIVGGMENSWKAYGGIVMGEQNIIVGNMASVLGGKNNEANGNNSAVLGGSKNKADGGSSAIAGGRSNLAAATHATVGGGKKNQALASAAHVSGGRANRANGSSSSVLGGNKETASKQTQTIPAI